MHLVQLAVAVALVALASAQAEKKPCCFPAQWEGKAMSAAESTKGEARALMPEIAVDFTNKRFAVNELVMLRRRGGVDDIDDTDEDDGDRRRRPMNITTIARFKANASEMFIIFWEHQHCIRKPLPGPGPGSKGHCIPKNATYGGSVTIGGDSGVTVDRWLMGRRKHPESDVTYDLTDYMEDYLATNDDDRRPRGINMASVTVSSKGCIPVSEHVFHADRRYRAAMSAFFFDIKAGIKDPSIFKPPSFCRKSFVELNSVETTPLTNYFLAKFD